MTVPQPDPAPRAPAQNPALVPDPPVRTAREYKVVGPRIVLGHKPGSTFTALIPEQQEALLIESGHIKHTKKEG